MTNLLSVLLCVYNGEKYIAAAVRSVLNQSFTDFEFIIVLDAPTDQTTKIVEAFTDPRIKLIYNQTNLGLTRSLNIGLKHCTGKYVARQDADDLSLPQRFETQLHWLSTHPEYVLLGSSAQLINRSGKKSGVLTVPCRYEDIQWQMFFENPFVHSSVLFKTEVIKQLGGYNEAFNRTQDFELWSRITPTFPVANLEESLVQYRHHESSISSTQSENSDTYGDIVFQSYAATVGIPKSWAKSLGTIRHTKYQDEDLPLLWDALKFLPQLKVALCIKYPLLKGSSFLKTRYPIYFEYIAIKSAGLCNRLSLNAFCKMLLVSPSTLFTFPYFRWTLRVISGVFGQETFEKLKVLRARLRSF